MTIKFTVTGLDCPNCAAKLASQIEKIDGINAAKINFLTERLTVDTELSKDEIYGKISAVAKAFSSDVEVE